MSKRRIVSKRRILIVEDNALIAWDLKSIASEAVGAETLVASSVAMATILMDSSIDLALLDVEVTDGNTYELAARLRSMDVPLVFVSAVPRENFPSEFREISSDCKALCCGPVDRAEFGGYF